MEPTDLHVEGVSTWIPLDLDSPAEETTRALLDRFGDDERTQVVATGLAGVAARIGQEGSEDAFPLAAWVRTPDDDTLVPLEVATLRAVTHRGSTAHELAEELVTGAELHSAVELGDLETASGPAATVRYRSVVTERSDRQVHEDNAVMWLRPEQGYAVVLSAHSTDLVSAVTLPEALHALAAGVHGL